MGCSEITEQITPFHQYPSGHSNRTRRVIRGSFAFWMGGGELLFAGQFWKSFATYLSGYVTNQDLTGSECLASRQMLKFAYLATS